MRIYKPLKKFNEESCILGSTILHIKGLHYLRLKANAKRKIEYINPVHLRKIRGGGPNPTNILALKSNLNTLFSYVQYKGGVSPQKRGHKNKSGSGKKGLQPASSLLQAGLRLWRQLAKKLIPVESFFTGAKLFKGSDRLGELCDNCFKNHAR